MRKIYFLLIMILGSLSYAQQTHSATVTISASCEVLGFSDAANEVLLIYPTPLKEGDQPTLKVNAVFEGTFSIIDLKGQVLLETKLTKGLSEVSLKNLTAGVYIVRLSNDQTQLSNRIIIE